MATTLIKERKIELAKIAANFWCIEDWKKRDYATYKEALDMELIPKTDLKPVTSKGPRRWWLDNCITNALDFIDFGDWCGQKNNSAYQAAVRYGWDRLCAAHMNPKRREHFTREEVIEIAQQHKNVTSWREANNKSYLSALRTHKCMDVCRAHMDAYRTWTEELCIERASQYTKLGLWKDTDGYSYRAAKRIKCYQKCKAIIQKNSAEAKAARAKTLANYARPQKLAA